MAICDATTLGRNDIIKSDFKISRSEQWYQYARYNAAQKWYFLQRQSSDLVLVTKGLDSKPGNGVPCTYTYFLEFRKIPNG